MVRSTGFGPINASGLLGVLFFSVAIAQAADLNITGPTGSVAFGTQVVALPNGNIVVTDPEGPVGNIGAVYLYSPDRILLATLTGGSNGDAVGSGGIGVVGNGNFLVISPLWRNPSTNATKAGAVTWVNGASGLSASVFEGNSLLGSSTNDGVGSLGAVVLDNGNCVVSVPKWDNGSVQDAGAVVWGRDSLGISGPVTKSNACSVPRHPIKSGKVSQLFAMATMSFAVRNGTTVAGGPTRERPLGVMGSLALSGLFPQRIP